MSNSKPKSIPMVGVKSSAIAAAGFDPTTKTLSVQFKNGGVYHYHGVEQGAFDNLMKAKSFGTHLQSHVVGKHRHTKL